MRVAADEERVVFAAHDAVRVGQGVVEVLDAVGLLEIDPLVVRIDIDGVGGHVGGQHPVIHVPDEYPGAGEAVIPLVLAAEPVAVRIPLAVLDEKVLAAGQIHPQHVAAALDRPGSAARGIHHVGPSEPDPAPSAGGGGPEAGGHPLAVAHDVPAADSDSAGQGVVQVGKTELVHELVDHGADDSEAEAVLGFLLGDDQTLADIHPVVGGDAEEAHAALRQIVGEIAQGHEGGVDVVGAVAQYVGLLPRPGVNHHHGVVFGEVHVDIGGADRIAEEQADARRPGGVGPVVGHLVVHVIGAGGRIDVEGQLEPAPRHVVQPRGHVGCEALGVFPVVRRLRLHVEAAVTRRQRREVLHEFHPDDAQPELAQGVERRAG